MNKIFLLIAMLMVMFVTQSFAQNLGVRAGLQASTIQTNGIDQDPLRSFYIGLSHTRDIGKAKVFSWYTGLEYTRNGFESDSSYRKISYISLPLAIRAHLGFLFLQAGYNANIKIGEKYHVNGVNVLTDENRSEWIDLPMQLGLGATFSVITIEARYYYSFLESSPDNHNAYLQLGAAVSF